MKDTDDNKTNYSAHAAYWDWDMFDRSGEWAFWHTMAQRYGNAVLSPMCALGQAAAYLAQRGFSVTGLDYTAEMIAEGKKRHGQLPGLQLVQGDIRTHRFGRSFDFCFIDGTDLHLFPTLEDVKLALANINRHLRPGGGLGLEVAYPMAHSHAYPMQRFNPRVSRSDGVVTWKEGDSRYDAATGRQDIHQILHVERNGAHQCIDHQVSLYYHPREALLGAFEACNFKVAGAYSDRAFNTSADPNQNGFFELVKPL